MALFKRGKYYHYDFELNGRRYHGSTKRTSKQQAESVVSTIRTRILNSVQGVPNSKAVPSFAEFADQFVEWAKVNLSKSTAELHRVNVDQLKKYLRGKLLNEIGQQDAEAFKVWRAKQKCKNNSDRSVSAATVNRNLTTLRKMYNYADTIYPGIRNPVRHVKFMKENPGRMRVLSVEEIDKYLGAAKGDLKDFAILATETGGRPAEILSLHRNDLHLDERFVKLPGTKTLKANRDVPLTDAALEVLRRRSEKSPNGFIFPVRRPKVKNPEVKHIGSLKKAHGRIIEKHFADAPFVLYDFRHTFATRCVQARCELPTLMELMGHTDITTTMRYVHPAKQQKIDAVEKLAEYVEMVRQFKKREEEEELPMAEESEEVTVQDEWGERTIRVPQFPQQSANSDKEAEDLSHLL